MNKKLNTTGLRPCRKAFIGAVIGAVGNIASGIAKRKQIKNAEEESINLQERDDRLRQSQVFANEHAYDVEESIDYKNRFANQYKAGGKFSIAPSKKGTFTAAATKYGKSVQAFASQVLANKDNYSSKMVKKAVYAHNAPKWKHAYGGDDAVVPIINRGGYAVPLNSSVALLRGDKHSNGGIDIGVGKNRIEAEGGEVVKIDGNKMKILSAQPILNGQSPANKVINNPEKANEVFEQQENYKDRMGLNDDGTSKFKRGGKRNIAAKIDTDALSDAKNLAAAKGANIKSYGVSDIISKTAGNNEGLKEVNRKRPVEESQPKLTKRQRFNKAFAEARKAGVKTFEFEGGIYGTQLATKTKPATKSVVKPVVKSVVKSDKTMTEPVIQQTDKNVSETPTDSISKPNIASTYRSDTIASNKTNVQQTSSEQVIQKPLQTVDRSKKGVRVSTNFGDLEKGGIGFDIGGKTYYAASEEDRDSFINKVNEVLNKRRNNNNVSRNRFGKVINKNNLNQNKKSNKVSENISDLKNGGIKFSLNGKTYYAATEKDKNIFINKFGSKNKFKLGGKDALGKKSFIDDIGVNKSDIIGAGISLAGNLASGIAGLVATNKMKSPSAPVSYTPSKLKTNYNIAPQLSQLERLRARNVQDIDANTASSVASLSRKQRLDTDITDRANILRGEKENIETELINRDLLNQQQQRDKSTAQYNAYQDKVSEFNNQKIASRNAAVNNMIAGITTAAGDLLTRGETRKRESQEQALILASSPDMSPALLAQKGYKYTRSEMEDFVKYGRDDEKRYFANRLGIPLSKILNKPKNIGLPKLTSNIKGKTLPSKLSI